MLSLKWPPTRLVQEVRGELIAVFDDIGREPVVVAVPVTLDRKAALVACDGGHEYVWLALRVVQFEGHGDGHVSPIPRCRHRHPKKFEHAG